MILEANLVEVENLRKMVNSTVTREITDMKKNQIRKNIVKALAKKMPDEQKQPIEIKSEAIPLSKAEQM